MKTIIYTLVTAAHLLFVANASSTVTIDTRRVYNPAGTDGLESFNGKVKHINANRNTYDAAKIAGVEQAVLSWMYGVASPQYMKDIDSSKFHWQFIESPQYDPAHVGVVIVLPHDGISPDFYTTLGGGLEIPAWRCYGADFAWVNNGEIISFVVDAEEMMVEEFQNWRFLHKHSAEDMLSPYYSQLIINYKTDEDLNDVKLFHFVDGNMRSEIAVRPNEKIYMPKGRFSSLVFYIGAEIKGVMCFDMLKIKAGCPMSFESTVYLRERLGYDKVLYAEPLCEGIYGFDLIDKSDFEALTTLDWQILLDLPGVANF